MSTQCTDIQRAFAREYVSDFNITRVSQSLGISRTTAYKWLGMPEVQDLVTSEMQKRATRTTLDMDRIIKELAMITQSDITDYVDNVGGRMLTFKELKSLPPEMTRCIQSIKETITPMGNIKMEIKLYDKLKAIQVVAQSLQLMIDQMREFAGMRNDAAGMTQIENTLVKVISAPGKTPTLLEWENQMEELNKAKNDGNVDSSMYDEPVIDAEYEYVEKED